ncbi:hypothetical protein CMI37_22370 [Candidatus Pacearchaeota archaeon]|nr:hypothetical protein [Candidatus Pacearchaeota archaeon]|tara:strand:+ start:122 stop:439 length:318 start_codon:yes stop_codon:yes gene_type:complete
MTEINEQIELIRRIANEKGMRNSYLLERFFAVRLPLEMNESYIGEWVTRFQSGNPVTYMDFQSILAYMKVIADIYDQERKVKLVSEAIKKAQIELKKKEKERDAK